MCNFLIKNIIKSCQDFFSQGYWGGSRSGAAERTLSFEFFSQWKIFSVFGWKYNYFVWRVASVKSLFWCNTSEGNFHIPAAISADLCTYGTHEQTYTFRTAVKCLKVRCFDQVTGWEDKQDKTVFLETRSEKEHRWTAVRSRNMLLFFFS